MIPLVQKVDAVQRRISSAVRLDEGDKISPDDATLGLEGLNKAVKHSRDCCSRGSPPRTVLGRFRGGFDFNLQPRTPELKDGMPDADTLLSIQIKGLHSYHL